MHSASSTWGSWLPLKLWDSDSLLVGNSQRTSFEFHLKKKKGRKDLIGFIVSICIILYSEM